MARTSTGISTTKAQHDFSKIPAAEIQRSAFNRSCGNKLTFDAGLLIPCFVDEILPGDTCQMKVSAFGRIATLLRPIMDNVTLDWFFFFVPYRLVWDNWVKMNGQQDNPGDSTDFLVPQIVSPVGGHAELSIYDYLGIPTKIANLSHSALPLRAINLIWNEWFRDQNLQTRLTVPKTDGPDLHTLYTQAQLVRAKRPDYFTSALPFPQKGTAVSLPLGTTATVRTNLTDLVSAGTNLPVTFRNVVGNAVASGNAAGFQASGGALGYSATAFTPTNTVYPANLYADLATASAATINQLRQSFQIQKMLERDARGGTRYVETILNHFRVRSPDQRLARPEYLGGGSTPLMVNEVSANNTQTAPAQQLGDFGGVGRFGTVGGIGFRQSFTEHGVVIGFVTARADQTYQQGLERMWSRRTRFDFFWPSLAHLGEQAVLNKEIYAQGTVSDDLVFGYQERYAEYRYKPSIVTGRFRSNSAAPLHSWHLAESFASLPALNATFISSPPPINRIRAVSTEPQFILDAFFDYRMARPMPVYSVPGLIDHF